MHHRVCLMLVHAHDQLKTSCTHSAAWKLGFCSSSHVVIVQLAEQSEPHSSVESCLICLLYCPSLVSVHHLFSCCHCADKLKGLPWQPQTLTNDNTVMLPVCRQQPKNPFILSSGASLVLEHVFLWAEHYKRFHILLSVKP